MSSGSGGRANRVTSDKREGNSFPLVFVCIQVVLAGLSKVLCKCSGKYIDIYFILKITCLAGFFFFFHGSVKKFNQLAKKNYLKFFTLA